MQGDYRFDFLAAGAVVLTTPCLNSVISADLAHSMGDVLLAAGCSISVRSGGDWLHIDPSNELERSRLAS